MPSLYYLPLVFGPPVRETTRRGRGNNPRRRPRINFDFDVPRLDYNPSHLLYPHTSAPPPLLARGADARHGRAVDCGDEGGDVGDESSVMPNQHLLHGQPLRRGVGLRRGLATLVEL